MRGWLRELWVVPGILVLFGGLLELLFRASALVHPPVQLWGPGEAPRAFGFLALAISSVWSALCHGCSPGLRPAVLPWAALVLLMHPVGSMFGLTGLFALGMAVAGSSLLVSLLGGLGWSWRPSLASASLSSLCLLAGWNGEEPWRGQLVCVCWVVAWCCGELLRLGASGKSPAVEREVRRLGEGRRSRKSGA